MRLFLRYTFQIIFGALAFLFLVKGLIGLVTADWVAATQFLLCAVLLIGAVWIFAQVWPTTSETAGWMPVLSDRAAGVIACLSLAAMGFCVAWLTYTEAPAHRSGKTRMLIAFFGVDAVASIGWILGLCFLYLAIRILITRSTRNK